MLQVWGPNTGEICEILRIPILKKICERRFWNMAKLFYNTVIVTFNRPEIYMVIRKFSENKCIVEKEIADLLRLVIYHYFDYICQQAIY